MFCGAIDDGSDLIDRQMARRYLRDCFPDSEIDFQMIRMRYAAERLVTAKQTKIATVAAALLKSGTLTGDQIIELAMTQTKVSASLSRA